MNNGSRKLKDETGNSYGDLVVIKRSTSISKNPEAHWECVCSCGNKRTVRGSVLRNGTVTSCVSCKPSRQPRKGKPNPTGGKLLKNETGNRYGRLLVIEYAGTRSNGRGGSVWKCKCDCGKETIVIGTLLRTGVTRSCGCLASEMTKKRASTRDGLSGTAEYQVWREMINRCHGNEKGKQYKNYGGRGITVCNRWRDSFDAFLEDMGKRPSNKHSIDRIDNNGCYSPENCRWATVYEQQNNKRNNRIVVYLGVSMTVAQAARTLGFSERIFSKKLSYYHGDIEKAAKSCKKSIMRYSV